MHIKNAIKLYAWVILCFSLFNLVFINIPMSKTNVLYKDILNPSTSATSSSTTSAPTTSSSATSIPQSHISRQPCLLRAYAFELICMKYVIDINITEYSFVFVKLCMLTGSTTVCLVSLPGKLLMDFHAFFGLHF